MNLIQKLIASVTLQKRDAKPVKFQQANFTYTTPAAMTKEQCGDLPCFRSEHHTVSCWHFTLRDRIKLLFTGCIWLYLLTNGHPPTCLMAESPFPKPEAKDSPKVRAFLIFGVAFSLNLSALIYFLATS